MCNTGFKMNFIRTITALLLFLYVGDSLANDLPRKSKNNVSDVYMEIKSDIRNKYVNEENVIRLYFSFTCKYCKQIHTFVRTWGQSLPDGMVFIETPVINENKSSQMLASAFKYVKENSKNEYYLDKFTENIYKHIHKISTTDELSRLIKEAMTSSKIDTKLFLQSFKEERFLAELNQYQTQQNDYGIEVTPTIVVGGKYLTHLGYVGGDQSKFIELINAITNLQLADKAQIHE
jgi:thiol:disulfide interchange protein DsbA